ncbi:hypothetical protein GIW19_17890 [Pseudomonas syringae]|uniref:hypothetical protein n=1 Tax=Pseudomonas syringae TaxID=317 RepID=UPI001F34C981|nr:hypothetical protein [Pseudomonas syringae]MCF5272164.1 hypothetical protein [Pseudomonas syringae]MCF5274220.1 hypothetical protein [Pseudomonas syringae]MCF5291681.1 hypothetical protein [Pseudomonas syringae]MCF5300024.1 hypothetical protein [Pseudomonas syringae]MCF5327867.1 hypothetical protein [Pseudomonas syringae]
MNYYLSEGERQYQEHRKAQLKAMIEQAEVSNNSLVGEVKTYKGVSYQMHQRGSYVCVGLPKNSPLEGTFTSAFALHKIIDDMELRNSSK